MIIGIDASRANHEQKTGVEWYAFFVIQELKKIFNQPTSPPMRGSERGSGNKSSSVYSADPSEPPLIGEEIHVVLYSDEPLKGELAILPSNWSSKVLHWPPKRLWTQLRMSYEMLVHPPDVLFIPAHVFPLIHPKKTVMTVHDVAALRFPHSYNWFERWYSTWSAKYAVQKLWQVIVPSEFTKTELISLFTVLPLVGGGKEGVLPLGKNISVVPHGFDNKFKEKKSEREITTVLKKYHIKKPFVFSIGRLEEKKNTVRIIQAFQMWKELYHHDDFQLLLVGKFGYGGEKVKKIIAESTVQKDIIHPGYVEQEDIPALFQAAEFFFFPSLYEGFGIPVLEAFASGVPVITSKNTSTEEIAEGAALLIHPEDTDDMVGALEDLSKLPHLRQTLIEKGKSRAQDFSWQKCAENTANILIKN